MPMTTIDTDGNLGLALRQTQKCGRVKPVNRIQSLPFWYLKIANKIKTKTDNKKKWYFIKMMLWITCTNVSLNALDN